MNNSLVRRPRMRLVINGTPVGACQSVETIARGDAQASTFHVVASASQLGRVLGMAWVDRDQLTVGVDFGFLHPGSREGDLVWTRVIEGDVDRLSLDQVSGLVALDGRDFAARLLDLPLQDAYLNTTSSDLAAALATRCGLDADIDPTSGLVGQYYQIEHSKTAFGAWSRHANGWDLLSELAEIEGYGLWVDGATLHFKQPSGSSAAAFDIIYRDAGYGEAFPLLSITDLIMDRTLGLSGQIQIKVSSWNSRQRQKINASYPAEAASDGRQFLLLKPNLLADQAESLAKTTYLQMRAQQRVISGRMAGELTLTPRQPIRLNGTMTGWDGSYILDRIERQMSVQTGFIQHITARSDPQGPSANE